MKPNNRSTTPTPKSSGCDRPFQASTRRRSPPGPERTPTHSSRASDRYARAARSRHRRPPRPRPPHVVLVRVSRRECQAGQDHRRIRARVRDGHHHASRGGPVLDRKVDQGREGLGRPFGLARSSSKRPRPGYNKLQFFRTRATRLGHAGNWQVGSSWRLLRAYRTQGMPRFGAVPALAARSLSCLSAQPCSRRRAPGPISTNGPTSKAARSFPTYHPSIPAESAA